MRSRDGRRSRHRSRAAALPFVAVVLLATLTLGCSRTPEVDEDEPATPAEPVAEEQEPFEAELFFPGNGSLLRVEARALVLHESLADQATELVEALLAGPESPEMHAPLPPSTRLAGLFLRPERQQVILDLRGADGAEPPPAGSRRELLTVYSLVNSLVLNLDGIDEVVILWNGRQGRSFSGHVDTAHPLVAAREMIDRRETAGPDSATAPE